MVFALGLVICASGCAANRAAVPGVEKVRKGRSAPYDGYLLSDKTFLMLYEAAEHGAMRSALKE